MKTAVIISGQSRTFARCLASQHWNVYRKLERPHFYVSVADDADAETMELLRKQYPNAPVFIERVTQPQLPEPPASLAAHAPYAISSPIQAILRQLWHLSRAWKFANENGAGECDVFIRARPDLHFHAFEYPMEFIVAECDWSALTPWWGAYGGVNDRLAVLGKEAARYYFEAWDRLPEILAEGCPLHPESIICTSMQRGGVSISPTLGAEFAALRPNGQLVHMVVLPQEMAAYTSHLSRK
jgi:hypothetical protein